MHSQLDCEFENHWTYCLKFLSTGVERKVQKHCGKTDQPLSRLFSEEERKRKRKRKRRAKRARARTRVDNFNSAVLYIYEFLSSVETDKLIN